MAAATQLWLMGHHVGMGAQGSQIVRSVFKESEMQIFLWSCLILLCISTKYITGLQTSTCMVISAGLEENELNFSI